jgi:uncharacterized membrane protein YgcG
MAERFRSAIESLFNVRDDSNALAPSSDERRRRRNEFIESLRSYGVPILFMMVGAALIAVGVHFLVWSFVAHIVMPLLYAAVPGLETVTVAGSPMHFGQFISYLIYAVCMIVLAVAALRTVLAKPRGYVRERTRTCPACGMTVLEVASKCRFCGAPLPTRRAYGSTTPSRGPAPALSSSSGSRPDDGPSRRRRGGRRRGGRGRSRSGSGGGPGSGSSGSGAGSDRSHSNAGSSH